MGFGCDDFAAVAPALNIITPRSNVDMLQNSTVGGLWMQNSACGGSVCPFIAQQGPEIPGKIAD
jgi:hypothetical protein